MYNVLLGKMFAQAAQLVVDKCGLNMEDITVIGCHGLIMCLNNIMYTVIKLREREGAHINDDNIDIVHRTASQIFARCGSNDYWWCKLTINLHVRLINL